MIKVEGYKAFHGTMKITPLVINRKPSYVTGDWLYKPDMKCWYCNGQSFPEEVCTVQSEGLDLSVDNISTEGRKIDDFKKSVRPLHEFLCKYYHPHACVIVHIDSAEVVEGSIGIPLKCPD